MKKENINLETTMRSYAIALLSAGYLNDIYILFLLGVVLSLIDLKHHPRGLRETVITMTSEHSASIALFLIVNVIKSGFLVLLTLKGYIVGFVIATTILAVVLKFCKD